MRTLARVSVTQLPRVPGATHELAVAGRTVWVTQYTADRVLRIRTDADGRVTRVNELAMPEGSVPHGLTAPTPDRVWVSLEHEDRLVRIDRSGSILASIALPEGTGPHAVLRARDGSLWYAGKEGSVIGHVDPRTRTVLRTWPLAMNSLSIYLAEAPDGAIWFTELLGSSIGRVKDGRLTTIPLPGSAPGDASARPIAIESDARGRIWFSEEAGNAVGYVPARIAAGPARGLTADALRVRVLPVPRSTAAGLVVTEAGTVWVQTYAPFGLVRVSPGGPMRQFTLPSAPIVDPVATPIPHRIHEAANGDLWFTELAGDRLGRIAFRR